MTKSASRATVRWVRWGWRGGKGLIAVALGAAVTVGLAPAVPVIAQQPDDLTPIEDLTRWVNPYVGTKKGSGTGLTYPGAVAPFGMVQWSPDTVTHQHGGYQYNDNRIKGFSLTHLSGAGCAAFQDFPFMPLAGKVTTSPASDPGRYVSTFQRANERATAGHYRVGLDSGVTVELTATQRTGMGQLTFPAGSPATLLVKTAGSVAGVSDAQVSIGTDSISGSATSGGFCGFPSTYRVYFFAEFDRPFSSVGTWKDATVTPGRTTETGTGSGGFVGFDTTASPAVNVRVGLSFVSADGAKNNLAKESGTNSFGTIAAAAKAAWNGRLNRIRVRGGTDVERTTFYTALYHSLLHPNVFSDVDGRYPGVDNQIHTAEPGHAIHTNISGWDVYRSEFPLLSLIAPREASDIARSMIAFAEQAGAWDRWTVANGYTGVMNGDPYHAMVASGYAFGARDFDARTALRLMVRGATEPTKGLLQERPGLEAYQTLGYVATGGQNVLGSAATTLEYTSADFAIADLARRLGDGATATTFSRRAQYWQNVFNPASRLLQPRNADGSFRQPFHPASGEGWLEGNSAQYSWLVPHNLRGLFTAMGGNAAVVKQLDAFFTELNAGPDRPHAWLGNEPVMHTPWLYNYAGAPYRTQQVTRRAMTELFHSGPDGLAGNDDLGQMSSWYVWAAMGMYPVIPGRAEMVLSGPLFSEVAIGRPTGATLLIRASGAGTAAPYITSVSVNGSDTTRTWLPESFVERGGAVDYRMSSTPNPQWGSGPGDEPPSFREGEAGQRGSVAPGRLVVADGGTGTASVGAQDFSGRAAALRWAATPVAGLSVEPSSGALNVPAGGSANVPVTVRVAAGTARTAYRIPVSFTAADGGALPRGAIQVLVAEPNSLREAFTNTGISPDANQPAAVFDLMFSYSAEALAAAGIRPGAPVTVDGIAHTWPSVEVGEPDNAAAAGQTVNLTAPAGATRLALLGSAKNGKASGTLTITYTDGSTQQVTVGLSDWGMGSGLAFNNRIVAQLPHRNTVFGIPLPIPAFLFATAPIPLAPGNQVRSVTLPTAVEGGTMHIFAITAG